jgi:hypothetical protein
VEQIAAALDKVLEMRFEILSDTAWAIVVGARLAKVIEIRSPGFFRDAAEVLDGRKSPVGTLERREHKGAVANGASGGGLVSCDESLVAAGVAEEAFECVVGGGQIRVVGAREDLGSEGAGGRAHTLQGRVTVRFRILQEGFPNLRQEFLEGTANLEGGGFLAEEFRGALDETVEESHVAGRGLRKIQGNGDMLMQLAKEEESIPPFFTPSSRASRSFLSMSRVSRPGASRG